MTARANSVLVFGIRFADSERIVLRDAAARLGWTITKLVRMSAVERAAHILNTSQRTKIDFPGIADRLARVLCDRTPHEVCDASDPEASAIPFETFMESLGPHNEGLPCDSRSCVRQRFARLFTLPTSLAAPSS